MMEHKLKLKFDDSFNGILFSTQGDTGRVFEIEVRDELDNAIDISGHRLEFYVGNDKKVTKVEGAIQGSKFIVKPVNEQFTKSGLNKAQFVLYDPQGLQVGSQIFDLHVEESIQNGATVGRNVIVDFSKINEALELIKEYEKTFEDSKKLDTTLSAHIEEGKKVNQELVSNTSAGRGLNENLKTSTTKASESYTQLEAARTSADTLNSDLKANIAQGNKTNANLQASISTAKSTQSTLQEKTAQGIDANTKLGQSIKTGQDVVSKINAADKNLATSVGNANTAKTNLDASIDKANTAKTNLDGSIDKANTTKTKLDEATSQGNATDSKLKDTDTKASTSISTLQDLLSKSASTEKNLKEIIASGELDKYVTEPKLQEALAKIKTLKKEVVDSLPQAGQDDVIYLVKDSKGKDNNYYLEYLWLDKWELIGSTQVDLSGYVTNEQFGLQWSDFINNMNEQLSSKVDKSQIVDNYGVDDSNSVASSHALYEAVEVLDSTISVVNDKKVDKVEGKGLSTNDFTDEDKAQIEENKSNINRLGQDVNAFGQLAQEVTGKAEEGIVVAQNAYVKADDALNQLGTKADKTEIKTKLSEMTDDSTHRLVTDSEKTTWNGKASKSDIKTSLSQLTSDSTHRTVTDAEKTKWNSVEELTTQEVEVICNEILK